MNKYKVIILWLSGKRNRVYESGDVITENDVNNALKLVQDGKIELIQDEPKEPHQPIEEDESGDVITENDVLFTFIRNDEVVEVRNVTDLTMAELKILLKEKEVDFKGITKKDELFSLYLKS